MACRRCPCVRWPSTWARAPGFSPPLRRQGGAPVGDHGAPRTARHRAWLRELPGWQGDDSVGTIVRRTWDWQLQEDNLPVARLIREIEGLAAGGRLAGHVPGLLADRSAFVAELLCERGVPSADALRISTLVNAAYAGLMNDFLTTGDRPRVEAALDELTALVDTWVSAHARG
ncbi:hypothetical protein GCM10020219_072290 [Nonomuraea dietziae]